MMELAVRKRHSSAHLGGNRRRVSRKLRNIKSKLDLLDETFTSFPQAFEPPELILVEDYFSNGDDQSSASTTSSSISQNLSTPLICVRCLRSINSECQKSTLFERPETVCKDCFPLVSSGFSNILRIDKKGFEPYYLLELDGWYNCIHRRLRWRWRLSGLIP